MSLDALRGKKLLILAGGPHLITLVQRAKELGIYTIVTDYYDTKESPANRRFAGLFRFLMTNAFAVTGSRIPGESLILQTQKSVILTSNRVIMTAFSAVGTLVAMMVGESGSEAMSRDPQQQKRILTTSLTTNK